MPEPGKVLDQLAAADGYDPSVHARMVRCPVMSVHGLADIMTEPREGDALADMVGCSRRVRIPGEGHMVSKKAYMEEYIDFLRSLRDVPPPLWRLSYV